MLEDTDWVTLEEYRDDGYHVVVEGTNRGPNPLDDFQHSTPDYYQVYYKTPWQQLITPTKIEPSADAIHSALALLQTPPEVLRLRAKTNVLQGFFVLLGDMSKTKGYCMVCGKTAKIDAHDDACILDRAMKILNAGK